MNLQTIKQLALAACALGLLAAASFPARAQLIKIDGSSTVFPVTEAMAEDFQNLTKNKVRVTVGISGTGGGFKKFCRGETDIQDASRPISKEEMAVCRTSAISYYELPIGFDAMAIVRYRRMYSRAAGVFAGTTSARACSGNFRNQSVRVPSAGPGARSTTPQ